MAASRERVLQVGSSFSECKSSSGRSGRASDVRHNATNFGSKWGQGDFCKMVVQQKQSFGHGRKNMPWVDVRCPVIAWATDSVRGRGRAQHLLQAKPLKLASCNILGDAAGFPVKRKFLKAPFKRCAQVTRASSGDNPGVVGKGDSVERHGQSVVLDGRSQGFMLHELMQRDGVSVTYAKVGLILTTPACPVPICVNLD